MSIELRARRRGMVGEMDRPSEDTRKPPLVWLAAYFRVPRSDGFSAYRTGWIGHLAFSAIIAAGVHALASTGFGLGPIPAMGAAFTAVILLWGIGVLVGVYSHYIPLIMLGGFLVIVGSIVLSAYGNHAMAAGLLIASAGHALMNALAFVLRLLRA